MGSIIEKIANSELEVLKILWKTGNGMTMKEIRKILTAATDWDMSTIKTLVRRLCEKGVINAEKREVFYYSPTVSEQEYNDYAIQQMIDRLYGGSAKNLVASLIDGNKLTDSDINELRSLFKEPAEQGRRALECADGSTAHSSGVFAKRKFRKVGD